MGEELDRRIGDALRMAAQGYDPETTTGERFPTVEREVRRRRRARAFAVTVAASVIVATIALSARLEHPATTRDADQGVSATDTTTGLGRAASGGSRIVIVPTPSRAGATTRLAGGPAGGAPNPPGAPAGAGTTDTTTGAPPSGTSGPGTRVRQGGSGGASTSPTSLAIAPPTTTTVTPSTVTPTTVTTTPVTPTTVTPTTVPVVITLKSGSTVDVTVGQKVEVELLQPSCPGSTWTSPSSDQPSILEPIAGPPATTLGAVAGWFRAAAPGPAQLTATVASATCVTPDSHFEVSVIVSW